jgi:hypothetical protein
MLRATKLSFLAVASTLVIASAAHARPHFRNFHGASFDYATIADLGDYLVVSNIGSSGDDGVGFSPESRYVEMTFEIPDASRVDAADYAIWQENYGATTSIEFDIDPTGSFSILFSGVGDPEKQASYFNGKLLVARDLLSEQGDPDLPVLVGRATGAGAMGGPYEMKWDNVKNEKWSTIIEFEEPIEFLPAGAADPIVISRIEIEQTNPPVFSEFPELHIHLTANAGTDPASVEFLILDGYSSPCRTDLNGDGVTDGADLAALLPLWGQNAPIADFNGDGVVDGADLAQLLAAWGSCTAP